MLGAIMYFCIWLPLRILRLTLWNWTIEGLENLPPRPQGFVLASNHVHWLDILIIGASLPLSHRPWWIAKVEIMERPLLAWWFNQMGVIPINRGKRDMAALGAAEDSVRSGTVLIIFPEGHRTRTGGLMEGRSGAVRIAARAGVPILPTAVWGTEDGLRGAFLRRPISISFGEPYRPDTPGKSIPFDRMNELTDEMMLKIADMLPEERRGVYRDRQLQEH